MGERPAGGGEGPQISATVGRKSDGAVENQRLQDDMEKLLGDSSESEDQEEDTQENVMDLDEMVSVKRYG